MHISLHEAIPSDYPAVRALYRRAFPADERMPFFVFRRRYEQDQADLLVIRNGAAFAGFAYLTGHADLVYLFFFAIAPGLRGKGCGSEVLRLLRQRYDGKRLFLCREPLDSAAKNHTQRIKRREFYKKNGFSDWPCQIQEAGVVYDVMGIGEPIPPKAYAALIEHWAGKLYCRLINAKLLPDDESAPRDEADPSAAE